MKKHIAIIVMLLLAGLSARAQSVETPKAGTVAIEDTSTHYSVWFPTAFTPTVLTNNTFSLYTLNTIEYMSIYIYDRRGAQVFHSTDPDFKWDGKCKGRYCDQGIYVWVCSYRHAGTTEVVHRRGTVLLLQ